METVIKNIVYFPGRIMPWYNMWAYVALICSIFSIVGGIWIVWKQIKRKKVFWMHDLSILVLISNLIIADMFPDNTIRKVYCWAIVFMVILALFTFIPALRVNKDKISFADYIPLVNGIILWSFFLFYEIVASA